MTRLDFRAKMVAEFGEPFTISYFDRSTFIPGDPDKLSAWSLVAHDKFRREARLFLQREGVTLGKPNPVHLLPGAKPVVFTKRDLRGDDYE